MNTNTPYCITASFKYGAELPPVINAAGSYVSGTYDPIATKQQLEYLKYKSEIENVFKQAFQERHIVAGKSHNSNDNKNKLFTNKFSEVIDKPNITVIKTIGNDPLQNTIEDLYSKLVDAEETIESYITEIKDHKDAIDILKVRSEEYTKYIIENQYNTARKAALESDIRELTAKLKVAETNRDNYRKHIDQLNMVIDEAKLAANKLRTENSELKLKQVNAEHLAKKLVELHNQNTNINNQNADLKNNEAQLLKEISDKNAAINDLNNKLSVINATANNLENTKKLLYTEVDNLKSSIDQFLHHKLENAKLTKELEKLNPEYNNLKKDYVLLKENFDLLKNSLASFKDTAVNNDKIHHELQDKYKAKCTEYDELKNAIGENQNEVTKLRTMYYDTQRKIRSNYDCNSTPGCGGCLNCLLAQSNHISDKQLNDIQNLKNTIESLKNDDANTIGGLRQQIEELKIKVSDLTDLHTKKIHELHTANTQIETLSKLSTYLNNQFKIAEAFILNLINSPWTIMFKCQTLANETLKTINDIKQ